MDANLTNIEVLFLGSSHLQSAINPAFINKKSCNLALGGQPMAIDYFILEKYITQMPNLNTVFYEISPHRFYIDLKPNHWNSYIYANEYDIDYNTKPSLLKNNVIIAGDIKFFSSIFFDFCKPNSFKFNVNKFGFTTNEFNDRFAILQYNRLAIDTTYQMQHTFDDQENFKKNDFFLKQTIDLCKKHHKEIVFITTPFYKTYTNQLRPEIAAQVQKTVQGYALQSGIHYLNFSKDERFTITDFKDDNHLRPSGATKITKIINQYINQKK
ncbi:MAG: hypothetical protein RL060_1428 [Bacteroidota bacterium]